MSPSNLGLTPNPLSSSFTMQLVSAFALLATVFPLGISALGPYTGSANNTVFIIPVDTSVVRSLVPSNYALLPFGNALPNFPAGKRPVIVTVGQDFDIAGSTLAFSQAHLGYPYVDRLGDGKSPFTYAPFEFADDAFTVNTVPLSAGAAGIQSTINPPGGTGNAVYTTPGSNVLSFEAVGWPTGFIGTQSVIVGGQSSTPWPFASYATIANQPSFGPYNPLCIEHVETVSGNVHALKGNVTVGAPPFNIPAVFTNVYGIMAVRTFTEVVLVDCSGYAVKGTSY